MASILVTGGPSRLQGGKQWQATLKKEKAAIFGGLSY